MLKAAPRNAAQRSPAATIKHLEQALEQVQRSRAGRAAGMRARMKTVLDAVAHVPCAILIANDHGRYVVVNDAAVAMTGYARRELLRMSLWDLTPAPNLDAGKEMWRLFLTDRHAMRGTYTLQRKDGEIIRAQFVALSHVAPGLHVSALITARRRMRTAAARRRKSAKSA